MEHTNTYKLMKRTIENQKKKGTLDVDSTMDKLDIFLMRDRITPDEYQELAELVNDEQEGNE